MPSDKTTEQPSIAKIAIAEAVGFTMGEFRDMTDRELAIARFAAYACETLAEQREAERDWESDNDAMLYRSIAKHIREALP